MDYADDIPPFIRRGEPMSDSRNKVGAYIGLFLTLVPIIARAFGIPVDLPVDSSWVDLFLSGAQVAGVGTLALSKPIVQKPSAPRE